MLAITQFEVHVLENGRWTIHARYTSEQRKAAVLDARDTEFSTGYPTKVICETYFPEVGESELVTTYLSPKAREMREARKTARRPVHASNQNNASSAPKRKSKTGQKGLSPRQFALRAVVAGAFSLIAATITALIVSWVIKRLIESGIAISETVSTNIVTYAYALLFIFFFMSLFRSRLRLHQLLAYLWAKDSAQDKKIADKKAIVAEIAPRLKPKPPSPAAVAEAQRAQDELKYRRGDLPTETDPPTQEAPTPPPASEAVPAKNQEPVKTPPKTETPDRAEQKEKAAKKKEKEREKEKAAQKDESEREEKAASAPETEEETTADQLLLERALMRRFVGGVIQPAIKTMPDDPVTRRGVALVLSGAASTLSEKTRLDETSRNALLEDALTQFGMNQLGVEAFMQQHDELVAQPTSETLTALGRSALSKYLEGADVAELLAAALAEWRTPFGQAAMQAEEASPAQPPVEPEAPPPAFPRDIFLLTDLRVGPDFTVVQDARSEEAAESERDAAMGTHNTVVRSVLGEYGGAEIKHTGAGIFSRFSMADAAIAAAQEIQRRFTATYGPNLAVALIENLNADDDPLLTSNVVRQAQKVVSQAADGEIIAERRVSEATESRSEDESIDADTDTNVEEAELVTLPAEQEGDDVPPLYEHDPAGTTATAAAHAS